MKDLTTGSIKKQLILLALPLIAGNILQQLYNTIDAVIIGRFIDENAFAAVGVAGTVMNLFIFIITGGCTGISIILAQYFGAGSLTDFRRECFSAFLLGIALAALISLGGFLALNPLLNIIETPADILNPAKDYLNIILIGMPAVFLYNFAGAILRSVGSTFATLLFLGAAVLINLMLDLLFIAVFHWQIQSAAAATALSQLSAALFCFIYIYVNYKQLLPRKEDCFINAAMIKHTLHLSSVTALHQSSIYLGKLGVQGSVNVLGPASIAAFTAASRIEGYANSFGDSGSAALSVFTAQNTGSKNYERIRRAVCTSALQLGLLGLACSTMMYFTAEYTAAFMLNTDSGTAFSETVRYLQTISLFYVLCFTGNTFVGYFDGIGKVKIPVIGAAGHLTLRVILSFALGQTLGLNAVAIATGIGWCLVNIFWFFLYRRRSKL